jgi:hypothetical protein
MEGVCYGRLELPCDEERGVVLKCFETWWQISHINKEKIKPQIPTFSVMHVFIHANNKMNNWKK